MSGVGGMGIGVVGAILVRAGHREGFRVIYNEKKGLAIRNGGVYSQITFVKDGDSESGSMGVSPMSSAKAGPRELHERDAHATEGNAAVSSDGGVYPTTGNIPYGKADLLLGIDILEAARATDPREQFRVASKHQTAAVLNLHKQNTVYALLGKDEFEPEELREVILEHCKPELSYSKNLSQICEERLGSKQFVNIMMLGTAYQLGLIPVSAHSIAWAIKDSIRREHRRNLKAFNIGRKLALEPRALPIKPEPETWEQLVTNKSRILRKTRLFGRTHAAAFEKLVQGAMKQLRDLPEQSKYDLAIRIYDLMQYQDDKLAKRYIELVRSVYKRDEVGRKFAATDAALWNLAKVMLIKDEPYVAYLLTRYEKKERDIRKYGVDVSNGDKLVYKHHTSPEFNIGKYRLRLKITTRDWHLQVVRHMKWWRKLPGWHKREVAFRDWYISLLDRVNLSNPAGYESAMKVLKAPDEVNGYREVRYPKMDRTMLEIEAELTRVPKVEVDVKRDVLDSFRSPTHV
jgi:indolepyruvate ferredoxin oxidoreductase